MFHDNETDLDLLGFEDQVDDLCAVVTDPTMLPVTVGVLGDWGSGKSSLLKMANRRLRTDRTIVAQFSPWRIETYDDAKTALLDAVIGEIASHPIFKSASEPDKASNLLEKVRSLRRRVRWFRVAGLAAKHLVTMTAPSLDEMDGLLRDDEPDDEAVASTARVARDFHEEFRELVEGLDAQVVVLVDDLDRCHPEQVLDVLQAIRLFLSVPGTAFVLATDERVVRDAVRIRYPQAAMASETDLPQEYLEKIIQVPLRIPPLGGAEVESYLNLLVAESHLGPADLKVVREKATETRSRGLLPVAMNVGIARDCLGKPLPQDAERDFELVGRIARLLASGLKGNPRQVKRFWNALELRRRAVARKGLGADIDDAVLAKLAVLEYSEIRRFRLLHQWQSAADGRPKQLASAEAAASPHLRSVGSEGKAAGAAATTRKAPSVDPAASDWLDNPWTKAWLQLEPKLTGVDLGPYFVLARDALHGSSVQVRRLPEQIQFLLSRLAAPTPPQREAAVREALALDTVGLDQLIGAGLERLGAESSPLDLGLALATVAEKQPRFIIPVLDALGQLPFTGVPQGAPAQIVNRLGKAARAEVGALLDVWETQEAEARLSRAAAQARKMLAPRV